MNAFWMIFWITFLATPLLYLICQRLISSGRAASGTHIWVYARGGGKVRDASSREVWEHAHPGRSWEKNERASAIFLFIFLLVAMVALLGWNSAKWWQLPPQETSLRLFIQYGSGVLGTLAGFGYFALQIKLNDSFFETRYRILHLLDLLLLVIGIVVLVIVNFASGNLPFSMHLLWIPAGLPLLVGGLAWLIKGLGRGRALRSGGNLEKWVNEVARLYWMHGPLGLEVLKATGFENQAYYKGVMASALQMLAEGKFATELGTAGFFERTEKVFLGLLSGRKILLKNQDMLHDKNEIIQAVQQFYFHAAQRCGKPIHPSIQSRLAKSG